MAPICSVIDPCPDQTCLLAPGDHPFIVRPSYLAYSQCRSEPASKLVAGVRSGEFQHKEQVSEDVFQRIVTGLMASPRSKPFAQNQYRDVMLPKKK